MNETPLFSFEEVVSSFLFLEGIGYVWIIRVFILIAIAAPLFHVVNIRVESNRKYVGTILLLYIGYEILFWAFKQSGLSGNSFGEIFELTILYLLPFGCVFGVGLRYEKFSIGEKTAMFFTLFVLWIFELVYFSMEHGAFVSTQGYKYPPRPYYLSYALAVSLFLTLVTQRYYFLVSKIIGNTVIGFIALNSLWVYLWHIFFLFFYTYTVEKNFGTHWGFQFFVIFLCSLLVVYFQIFLIKKMISLKCVNQEWGTRLLRTFSG